MCEQCSNEDAHLTIIGDPYCWSARLCDRCASGKVDDEEDEHAKELGVGA